MDNPSLVCLHRDCKGSTRWLEPTLERVRAFAERYGADPDLLINQAWRLYGERSMGFGLWALVDDEQVVGHAYAVMQQWDNRWVAWISQVDVDAPVTTAYRALVLRTIEEWIGRFNALYRDKGMGVDTMMMVTPRMHSAWSRHSGFEPYKVLHKRPVSPVGR